MKMKPTLHAWCAALLLAPFGGVAGAADAAPSAEQRPAVEASSPKTRELWEQVLTTLETRNPETSLDILKRFDGVKDAAPYQRTFTAHSLRLLTEARKPKVLPELPGVTANNARIEALGTRIEKEEERKPLLHQQVADASKVGPVGRFVEWLTGLGDHGRVSEWGKTSAERDLKEVDATIAGYRAEIAALQKANTGLLQAAADKAAKEQAAFREKVMGFLREQADARRSRPAIALATLWLNTTGADAGITTLLQASVAMLKAEKDAIQAAAPVIQAAKDLVAKGRLWDARLEIAKALEVGPTRATDPLTLEFLKRELTPTANSIDGLVAKAMKQRDALMEIATRDGADAARRLEEFRKAFPDYPGYDQDRGRIGELRVQQVGKRFSKDIADIEEMIPKDPARAKSMIRQLFTNSLDQDETAILKALVAKVNLKIVQQEAGLVRADFDQAYSVLSQFDAAYAEDVKAGKTARAGMIRMFTAGIENLANARSLQEKSLQRLKLLLVEEMDDATKAPLTQMLGKETASLKQMDDALAQHQWNKTAAIVVGSVLLLGLLGGGAWIVWKRKKKDAAVQPTDATPPQAPPSPSPTQPTTPA